MRMHLDWLANMRPECVFEILQLAKITEYRLLKDKSVLIHRLNMVTKYAIVNQISRKIQTLHVDSLRIVGYSDALFANNHYLSTQIGHVSLLVDGNGNSVLCDSSPTSPNESFYRRWKANSLHLVRFLTLMLHVPPNGEIFQRHILVQL